MSRLPEGRRPPPRHCHPETGPDAPARVRASDHVQPRGSPPRAHTRSGRRGSASPRLAPAPRCASLPDRLTPILSPSHPPTLTSRNAAGSRHTGNSPLMSIAAGLDVHHFPLAEGQAVDEPARPEIIGPHALRDRHREVVRFCRKVRFLGQNSKIWYQKFNDLQNAKLSKKQLCDRTNHTGLGSCAQ
jgi:hypothetical protein